MRWIILKNLKKNEALTRKPTDEEKRKYKNLGKLLSEPENRKYFENKIKKASENPISLDSLKD